MWVCAVGSVCVRFAACAHMDTRDHEPAHLNVTRCSLCILLLLLARDGDASSSPNSRRLRSLLDRLELLLRLPRRLISSCSSLATLIGPVPRRQARTRSLAAVAARRNVPLHHGECCRCRSSQHHRRPTLPPKVKRCENFALEPSCPKNFFACGAKTYETSDRYRGMRPRAGAT